MKEPFPRASVWLRLSIWVDDMVFGAIIKVSRAIGHEMVTCPFCATMMSEAFPQRMAMEIEDWKLLQRIQHPSGEKT